MLVKNLMPLTELGMLNLWVSWTGPLVRVDLARMHRLVCVDTCVVRLRRMASCLFGAVADYVAKVVPVVVIVALILVVAVRAMALMILLAVGPRTLSGLFEFVIVPLVTYRFVITRRSLRFAFGITLRLHTL